jgi:hypothetical protein
VGLLTVVLTGEVAASPVWEALMLDPYRRESGHLVFFQGEGQTFQRLTFYNAACVFFECRFDARGREGQGSFETELRFSAATLDVQGQRIDAHSVIPWATDAATSGRALTKPSESPPMPPGPSLLGAALEQAATVLGSPAARVTGAAPGTVALVLQPANDPNVPGYEAEKNFSNSHPTMPPDPDAFHLVELERVREGGALTPAEEAEYVALLAKVKGIHMQSLADLNAKGPLRGSQVALPGFHIIQLSYTKRSKADLKSLRDKFDSSGRKDFLKKIGSDPVMVQQLKKAGLTDKEVERIADGKVPNTDWQVHHKLPLDDGGDNSFDNLVLIKNDPYHKAITNRQNASTRGMQPGQTLIVSWPICSGFIYPN